MSIAYPVHREADVALRDGSTVHARVRVEVPPPPPRCLPLAARRHG